MKVKSESEVAQLCPTLSDPMDCSLPGSSTHGILQARILEGLPFPFPKKNEILPFTAMQMDLENIILSIISQTEKDKYYMISLICRI